MTGEGSDEHFTGLLALLTRLPSRTRPNLARATDGGLRATGSSVSQRTRLRTRLQRIWAFSHHVQIKCSTSNVQQRLHSLQSLGRNYSALHPSPLGRKSSAIPSSGRREPGRCDIKALHVVLVLQVSDVEGLYICDREVG
jgi:hypothetical protein